MLFKRSLNAFEDRLTKAWWHTHRQTNRKSDFLSSWSELKIQILNGLYLLDLRLVLAARALLEHLAYFSATSCLSAFSFIMVPVEYPVIYLDQNTPNTEIHYYQTMSRWTYADSLSLYTQQKNKGRENKHALCIWYPGSQTTNNSNWSIKSHVTDTVLAD